MADVRDSYRPFKTYTIPRKERRPSEDCQYTLPVDSREAKEIEHAIRRLTWDTNDVLDRAVSISHIKKVDNPNLEREYHEKRSRLREEGRSPKELTQQLAFCVETLDSRVKEICRMGLECDGVDHTLGDGVMGVTVWRCPDLCLRALSWPTSGTAYLLVFKIVKGRVKSVTPKLCPETPNLEPTPNYDSHISRSTATSSVTDLSTLMRSTQYYLYEYDDEGLPLKRPRHCLPFAVIPLKRNEITTSPIKPLISLEKPASPVKESIKPTEDIKTPSFNDEDGILAWRGLVTSNEKSLGCVSLLAGHKLGFNFWKSYLDVSRKIPLKQLGTMLPGDARSAWKSPLLYRNQVLSLCTMKIAPRQLSETFTVFTRHLAIKVKSAGVLCIDSFTTMFLVPSSKLAVHLGFCATEEPPRMFCIVCRRHTIPLSPIATTVWPVSSPVTPPAGSRSAPSSHTGTPVGTVAIRPASLDLKAQHKAKIVVSSPGKNLRLSPKRANPRQIAKRSLSFSYSPAKNASKCLQRMSRSASTSGRVGFRGDSTAKPAMLSEVSNDNTMHMSDAGRLSDDSKAIKGDSHDSRTRPEEHCLNSASSRVKSQDEQSCNEVDAKRAKTTPDLQGVSRVSSANTLTSLPPELVAAACTSPSSRSFSPFWPDSPLLFFPGSERIPFLSDTPVKKDGRNQHEGDVSVNSGDTTCLSEYLEQSQQRDNFSGNTTRNLTTRDEAVSTSRALVENPFEAIEEKDPRGVNIHLENWNTNSSYLNDKRALRNLRKAVARAEIPKLHKNKNTELQDNLQTIDMDISESPLCPIILSHTYSSPSSMPPCYSSSRSHSSSSINLAGSIAPYSGGHALRGSAEEHARNSVDSSSHSYAADTLETPSSVFGDPENAWKNVAVSVDVKTTDHAELSSRDSSEYFVARDGTSFARDTREGTSFTRDKRDARAFPVDSAKERVDVDPGVLESGDIVEPIDMDIADDSELLSNTVACESDTSRGAPTESAEIPEGCNTKSIEAPLSSTERNGSSQDEDSLSAGTNPSKQTVLGISAETLPEVPEVTTSKTSTDCCSETTLPSRKRPYSCLASSLEQDADSSVATDLHQNPGYLMLSTTSDTPVQTTCSPNKDTPSTCSLTNRKALGFSFSPKKCSQVCARQLKTLQDAFTVATNCDQPNLCGPDDERSAELSSVKPCKSPPRKSTVKTLAKDICRGASKTTNCIGIKNADDSATIDERKDCKPLAVSCTAFEKEGVDLPGHTGSNLGGVIETSLYQDWGLQRGAIDCTDFQLTEESSYLTIEELDIGATEVTDLGSEADKALEPIEMWPMIEDCIFPEPEPETVMCSPVNSIETFTFRFPGKFGFEEDVTELFPTETRTTEEENTLVEERFRGVCMVPEVVICSDVDSETIASRSEDLVPGVMCSNEDSETIVPRSEDLEPGSCPPERHSEGASPREELKTSGFQCLVPGVICTNEDSETIVPRSEDLESGSCSPEKHSEGASSREELKTSGFQCLDSQRVHEPRVSQVSGEELHSSELSEAFGSAREDRNALEGESSVEHPILTVNCEEGSLAKLSASLASSSVERSKEVAIQSKESAVSLESDRGDYESVIPTIENCSTEKLTKSDSKDTEENVALPTTLPPLLVDPSEETSKTVYSSETREKETCHGNACSTQLQGKGTHTGNSTGNVDTRNSLNKLPCSTLMQGKDRHTRNAPERAEAVNCLGKLSYSTQVQGKEKHPGIVAEKREETVNCPGKLSYSTQVQRKEKHLENAAEKRVETVNFPGKLPCLTEVNKKERHPGNVTEREETINLPCSSECPTDVQEKERIGNSTDVQGKRQTGNSTERVQALNCPNDVAQAKVDPRQEPVIPDCVEPKTLQNCDTDHNLQVKPSRENKPFTATLSEGVKPIRLDSSPQTQNYNKRQCSGVNNTTDFTATKDVSVKTVEPCANTVKHCKSVEKTTKTVESLSVTTSQPPRSSKMCEVDAQKGKSKDGCCGSPDRDARGKSEPLGDMNDLQKDSRMLNWKRKHVTEPEKVAKQRKLSPVPPLMFTGGRVERDHMARENSREMNFGDNRFCGYYTERDQCDYLRQADHDREEARLKTIYEKNSYPCWVAPTHPPTLRTHSHVHNGDRDGLPHPVPNDPRWYPQRDFTNHDRFQEQVQPRLPDYDRPMFVPNMCRARPMFPPAPTMPGPWHLPGNSCHVPYPLLRPR